VVNVRRYRQGKALLVALVLIVAACVGGATYAFNAAHGHTEPGGSKQCDLPLEQRTGGWVCPR